MTKRVRWFVVHEEWFYASLDNVLGEPIPYLTEYWTGDSWSTLASDVKLFADEADAVAIALTVDKSCSVRKA